MGYESKPKVVGAACNRGCGGKYVFNPKTGKTFCDKRCWLNDGSTQVQTQNVTQSNLEAKNDPLYEDLQRRVAELELSRVRAVDAYRKLSDEVKSLAALVSTVTGENAVNLHTSIPPKAPIDTRSAKDMPLDPEYAAEILGGTVEKKWEFPRKP